MMPDKQNLKKTVLAIIGPTASGKSSLALRLARALPGEVISGDSMQIYRGMDIGTAKASASDREAAPHHLIDIREPGDDFDVAVYQVLAREAIRDIARRGKTPIIAGGTGLYIDSALYNYIYKEEKETEDNYDLNMGHDTLWEKLNKIDPDSAKRLHPNDKKRVLRALRYCELHGESISANRAAYESPEAVYPMIRLGLNTRRDKLYQLIDRRVDKMIEDGLMSEVSALRERGLTPESQAGHAIGYKQALRFLRGDMDFPETVSSIKRESRRYAKRQLTWFRRDKSVIWLDAELTAMTDFEDEFAGLIHSVDAKITDRESAGSPARVEEINLKEVRMEEARREETRSEEARREIASFFHAKGLLYEDDI